MPPIRLTDEELSAIMLACQPLAPEARDGFVQAVAAGLRGHVVGPGLVHRVVAQVQRQFFDPPDLASGSSRSRRAG